METLINIKELSSIEVIDKKIIIKDYYYIYKEEYKFLWWTITKKGWYQHEICSIFLEDIYIGLEEPDQSDKYTKPKVVITMNNGYQETRRFNTLIEAGYYSSSVLDECNHFGVNLANLDNL